VIERFSDLVFREETDTVTNPEGEAPVGDASVDVIDEVTPDAVSPEVPEEELDPATALKNDLRRASRGTGTSSIPTPAMRIR
jgi:hypothetical protein